MNVTGSADLTLDDVETAAGIVQQEANPDANIIFGATSSPDFEDEMRVTVIATGFEDKEKEAAKGDNKPGVKGGNVGDIDAIFDLFNR